MSKVKIFFFLSFFLFLTISAFSQGVFQAWVARYNGPWNDIDIALALAIDGSGNLYVTGYSYGSGTSYDYATIKYASNGDTLWVRRYNGPGTGYDQARALALDGNGNLYVTGYSYGSVTNYDYATIKYAPNGDTLWVRRYNGPGSSDDYAFALALDGSGNVYVTGYSYGSGTLIDYATIKYAPNGDTLWVRRYNGPGTGYDQANALTLDGNGNLYVTGYSYGSVTNYDYATIKYAPNGDTLWVRRYNGPGAGYDQANTLALDGNGNLYVTGYSWSGTSSDYATIKYAPNGDTLWVRRYNGPANSDDYALALTLDGSGNLYVTGYSYGSVTNYDYATIKYAPNGDTLWVRRYNGPGNNYDQANALALDGSGNVYVTGFSEGDYATIKYAPNGDTLWVRRYNGPGNSDDRAFALALDGSGNLYVTGRSYDTVASYDYATIKYSNFPPNPIRTDTLTITAYSPVNLVVTDPKQDSISLTFNTILEGSTYDTTQDVNNDGEKDDVVRIPKPYVGEYKIRVVPADTGHYSLGIRIDGSDQVLLANNAVVPETSTSYEYSVLPTLRGDVNKDKGRNLTDIIFLVNYIFKGGTAPNPIELGNVNCSLGAPNLTDIVYMVNYVFKGGKAPCS